jgi:hypothetical protein
MMARSMTFLQFPDVARPLVLLKSIPVVVRHTRLIGKLLEELREEIRALSKSLMETEV